MNITKVYELQGRISSDNESSPVKIATTDVDDEVSDKINIYGNSNHPRDTIVFRGQQYQQHHYPSLNDKSNMPMIMEETRFLDVEIDVDIVVLGILWYRGGGCCYRKY